MFYLQISAFARAAPGIGELNTDDLNAILARRLFPIWFLLRYKLCIEGENYIILPNGIQHSRVFMQEMVGIEKTNLFFDLAEAIADLDLTSCEFALVITLTLTLDGEQKCLIFSLRNRPFYFC